MTNDEIKRLIEVPKWLVRTEQRRIKVFMDLISCWLTSDAGDFEILVRRDLRYDNNFSCMLFLRAQSRRVLRRYDGDNHAHTNHLESWTFRNRFHIHQTTERYVRSRYPDDGFARPSRRFTTCEGALQCLLNDCHVENGRVDSILNSEV